MDNYSRTITALISALSVLYDGKLEKRALALIPLLVEERARHWTKGAHGYFTGSYSDGVSGGSSKSGKRLDKSGGSGIIKDRNITDREMANGHRRDRSYILTDEDISYVTSEAQAIDIPPEVLNFNSGNQTGFSDFYGVINIKGDIFPDETSTHNRDTLSVRAVLAHEYYGHYKAYPSRYSPGDWRDEFHASYDAAAYTPNLSDIDRGKLMIDAYDRAREAGVVLEYDSTARRLIYGY